jgi:hypothetical protein
MGGGLGTMTLAGMHYRRQITALHRERSEMRRLQISRADFSRAFRRRER